MDKTISKLLGEGTLPNELVSSLQEAFDNRIAEVREETEMSLREEFSRRFEHDKANLVEAMDRMLTDVVETNTTKSAARVVEFTQARDAFRKGLREARSQYKTKINETLDNSRSFVKSQLVKEVSKLREEKKILTRERLATAQKFEKLKESMAKGLSSRIGKIDEFVIGQVRKELSEFNEDHRALVETRLKLVKESRSRLHNTQKLFVKEAAKKVEGAINEALISEMKQLHEDLERNRQNMFGRKIFEAVAAEYMTSYLAEGTEVRKLQTALESKEKALSETRSKYSEIVKESQQATRKAKVAEERAIRSKTIGELLANLRGDKRVVMEGMLESVKTDALRENFNRLLPMVLDESPRGKTTTNGTRKLVETVRTGERPRVVSGGNHGAARQYENNNTDTDIDSDFAEVIRLAGIQK
jgi:Txe/YoeB family toxin of Txe-Axe toxin-antitoxin module